MCGSPTAAVTKQGAHLWTGSTACPQETERCSPSNNLHSPEEDAQRCSFGKCLETTFFFLSFYSQTVLHTARVVQPKDKKSCTLIENFGYLSQWNTFKAWRSLSDNGVRVRLVAIPEPKHHDSTEKEACFQTERKMDQSFQHLIFCLMCTELLSRVPLSMLLSTQNQLLCCWLIFRRDKNLIHWHFAGF